jgi:hypothetical protein
MRKPKLPDWNWWALVPLAALALVALTGLSWEAGLPKAYGNAAEAQPGGLGHADNNSATLIFTGITALLRNAPAVEAAATVLLAIITVFLAFIANSQHKTTRAQLRAYCGPAKFEYNIPKINDATFDIPNPPPAGYIFDHYLVISAKNYGSTPASNLSVFVNWQPMSFGYKLPDDFRFDDKQSGKRISYFSSTVVDPGSSYEALVVLDGKDLAILRAAKAKAAVLFLYGRIDYTDVFRRRWRRDFCVQWCPWNDGVHEFVPYEANNGERQI